MSKVENNIVGSYKKKFKSFNYYSQNGENKVNVKTNKPMTLDEAMDYFNALAISGNEE